METKNIKTLLSESNVIIPEIQREYVWGRNNNILSKFVSDLQAAKSGNPINIGFLYRYSPYLDDTKTLYIIDGQQRFTTIILLLRYLNQAEKMDDDIFKFSYRVRSTSEEFLLNIFKSRPKSFDKKAIKSSTKYYASYELDTTIKAMIEAFDYFSTHKIEDRLNYESIIEYVNFWVFDTGETSQGEELYLSMNSRGEQLEDFENIKPLLFKKIESAEDKLKYGKLWDKWEDFFFENMNNSKKSNIEVVNVAMNNFISIVYEFKSGKRINALNPIEHSKTINLEDIEGYFDTLQRVRSSYSEIFSSIYSTTSSLLKVLIASHKKHSDAEQNKRVYNVFYNIIERRKIRQGSKLVEILKDYLHTSTDNIYNFILSKPYSSESYFDQHEIDKARLCQFEGCVVEKAFERAQNYDEVKSHYIWRGDISLLIKWSTKSDIFDLSAFNNYVDIFGKVFIGECEHNIDMTRKALLTRELSNYPLCIGVSCTFGWQWEQWTKIISLNSDKFQAFFDEIGAPNNAESALESMVRRNRDYLLWWSIFIEDNDFLKVCGEKNVQLVNHDIIRLLHYGVKKGKRNYSYLYGWQKIGNVNNWSQWKPYEKECLYSDHKTYNIAIDLCVAQSNEPNDRFFLQIFNRGNNDKPIFELGKLAEKHNLTLHNGRYESLKVDSKKCYELCEEIRSTIHEYISNDTAN